MTAPKHWILDQPEALQGHAMGLTPPARAIAVVLDGYSTEDGKTFDRPPFAGGAGEGMLGVFEPEAASKMYSYLSALLRGQKMPAALAADESEALVAWWDVSEGQVLLGAITRGASPSLSLAWDDALRLAGVLHEDVDRHYSALSLDASSPHEIGRMPAAVRAACQAMAPHPLPLKHRPHP